MPTYEFRCQACGPFEETRPLARAGAPGTCPECDRSARRVYTAPGFSLPQGALRGAGTSTRRVIDRAFSGEPVITGKPVERRLPAARHAH